MKRFLAVLLLAAAPAPAVIVDRVAAVVETEVVTLSEIDQLVMLRLIARNTGESEDAYRRRVLETIIAQMLRHRDLQRFGPVDVPKTSVDERLLQIQARFPSLAAFEEALVATELTETEVRDLITGQLQVEAYIEERFSPLIFVPLEQIETYYRETWVPERRRRNLPVPPIAEVREQIRGVIRGARLTDEIQKWTDQLRGRVNVDIYAW